MRAESELKVLFGRAPAGGLVQVESADASCTYFCPGCDAKLVLRDGDIRQKHFSHPSHSRCTQETILHKTAKALLAEVIEFNASGIGARIELGCQCDSCNQEHFVELKAGTFSGAAVEKPVGPYVGDVVAARSGKDALVVEVVVAHHIEPEKAANLTLPWIEVMAEDILASPRRWSPVHTKLKPTTCSRCRENIRKVQEVCDRWGVERSIYTPLHQGGHKSYVAAVERCFKCHEEIPVFWWAGVPFCESSPPQPRPRTIARKYSKQYGGPYWANTCASCGVIQGDNYLFLFDDAVLGDMPLSESFKRQRSSAAVSAFMNIVDRNLGL